MQQHIDSPIIIETGCQRQEEDVGAGMSTSLFAEYVERYGGHLVVIDNNPVHLARAISYTQKWPHASISFHESDSVSFLEEYKGKCDLLYLDSLDYPIAENLGDRDMQIAAQEHCLKEFKAMEDRLGDSACLLLDDNQLGGGGKPILVKEYLLTQKDWTLLLDLQSSLWIKKVI